MALPAEGQISMNDVNVELGYTGTAQIALNDAAVRTLAQVPSGAISLDNLHGKSNIPVSSGLVGWYDTGSVSGSTWTDKSGNGNNATITGASVTSTSGNGASNLTSALYGSSTAHGVSWPAAILPSTYTMFHVTRYTGSNNGRIIQGQTQNWLDGHWNGQSGVAYHNGWLTYYYGKLYNNDWGLSTSTNSSFRTYGAPRTFGGGGSPSYDRLTININPAVGTGENSTWMCAEVIVYNRTLNSTEIASMESWLATKYGISLLSATYSSDYFILGGGGGGGSGPSDNGGGGGGGGGIVNTSATLTAGTNYSTYVGAGGSSSDGGWSYFNGTYAWGGGKGGNYQTAGNPGGGCGGGGGRDGGTSNGGAGGQGYAGGASGGYSWSSAGGGGGAGGVGYNGVFPDYNAWNGSAGTGGIGAIYGISGNNLYWAGGGGGAWQTGGNGVPLGNSGGGGNGCNANVNGGSGTANTGGGGGAAQYSTPGNGGSGIVIVRYVGSKARAQGGGYVGQYTVGGTTYTIHIFYSSDTYYG